MKAVILLYMLLIVSFTSYATQVNTDGTIKEVPMSTTATSYELTASPPSSEWTFTKGFSLSANGNGWYKVPPEETSYSAKYERRDNVTTYWVDSATVFGTVISGTMYKKTGGNGGAGGGAPVYWGLKAVGNQAKNPTIYPLGPLSLPVGIATEFKYLFNGVEAPGGTWKYSGNTAATPSANVSTNYGNVTGSRFSFPASGIVPGVYHLSAARNTAGDQEASSDAITVVGVKQVSATYGTTTITSTTNTPGNNETLYVPKGTSSITITATPEPESSWPNEYPTFKVNGIAVGTAGSTTYSQSTNTVGIYTVSAACGTSTKAIRVIVWEVISETVATSPSNRKRKTLGIGEEVNLSTNPAISVTWSVSGGGKVSSASGPTTTFSASKSPSTSSINAKIGNDTCLVSFSVIAPNGMNTSLKNDSSYGTLGANYIGAKSVVDCTVLPNNVSFYNVEFRENIPGESYTWPDGTSGSRPAAILTWHVGYDNKTKDSIASGLNPIRRIYNGSNYVNFKHTVRVPEEYKNESGAWVTWLGGETHPREYRASDQKARVKLEASNTVSGGWMGPWQ